MKIVDQWEAPALSAPEATLGRRGADFRLTGCEDATSRGETGGVGVGASSVSDELADAWRANARCAECGEPVREVSDAALLVGPNRVAHRDGCFVPALLRTNPMLKLLAARGTAQEVTIAPTTPLGVVPNADSHADERVRGGRRG
jgi:hypothetical protein